MDNPTITYVRQVSGNRCPFCGRSIGLVTRSKRGIPGGYQVRCLNRKCIIQPKTEWVETDDVAIARWTNKVMMRLF